MYNSQYPNQQSIAKSRLNPRNIRESKDKFQVAMLKIIIICILVMNRQMFCQLYTKIGKTKPKGKKNYFSCMQLSQQQKKPELVHIIQKLLAKSYWLSKNHVSIIFAALSFCFSFLWDCVMLAMYHFDQVELTV